jgi:hypothetical protein
MDVADWEIGHRVLQIWAICIGKSLAVMRSRDQEETDPGRAGMRQATIGTALSGRLWRVPLARAAAG